MSGYAPRRALYRLSACDMDEEIVTIFGEHLLEHLEFATAVNLLDSAVSASRVIAVAAEEVTFAA